MRATTITALLALGLVATAPTAHAGDGKRYTTVFEESLAGQIRASSAAELAFMDRLMASGFTFLDENQARKIRSATTARALLKGSISKVITAQDADVIVAAVVQLARVKSDLLGPDTYRFNATLQAKVIAVDNGQVIATAQVRGEGMAFTQADATQKAAAAAGANLAQELLKKLQKRAPGRMELIVTGIPTVTRGDAVQSAVAKLPVVASARVIASGRGATKIDILPRKGATARAIALALDKARAGVAVFGFSDRVIQAEYRPETAMRIPAVVAPLTARGKDKRHAWRGSTLAGIAAAELTNLPFLSFPRGHEATRNASRQSASSLGSSTGLLLAGSYRAVGEQVSVALRLDVLGTKRTLTTRTATCERQQLASCVRGIGASLAESLLPALIAKRQLLGETARKQVATAPTKSAPTRRKPVRIIKLQLDNVYPSRMNAYARRALGRVTLKNTGKKAITDVVVAATLPGFAADPVDSEPVTLAPGATVEVPVRLVLDRARLMKHDENQPAVMKLTIRYAMGDLTVEERRSRALIVYDRNTLSWKQGASIGSFVAAQSPAVRSLASALAKARPSSAKASPVTSAIALFAGLGHRMLSYQADPVNPYGADTLDYVQYPDQTLIRGSGDCDDLAVLYAAMAESLGLKTLLVTTPKHVFVAVDTGVPARAASTLSPGGKGLILHAGRAWLPLETTLVGKPVTTAWKAAARELKRFAKRPDAVRLTEVRKAWQQYPPVSLTASAGNVTVEDTTGLTAAIGRELRALENLRKKAATDEQARLNAALAKNPEDAAALMAKGATLVAQGDFAGALPVFERAARDKSWSGKAWNNVGNAQLSLGRVKEARPVYDRAAKRAPKEPRILANAALAAFADKDEDAFAEYIFSCMELGADAIILELARAGISVDGGVRGANTSGLAARDLTEAIVRAYHKKKRTPPAALVRGGVRAANAAARAEVSTLVFWL